MALWFLMGRNSSARVYDQKTHLFGLVLLRAALAQIVTIAQGLCCDQSFSCLRAAVSSSAPVVCELRCVLATIRRFLYLGSGRRATSYCQRIVTPAEKDVKGLVLGLIPSMLSCSALRLLLTF